MHVYVGSRGTGKTFRAIITSALTGGTIVAPNEAMANYIQEQAMCIGLDIPKPISVKRFIEIKAENKDYGKTYIFDEAQMILSSLGVLTAIFSTSSCTICSLDKEKECEDKCFGRPSKGNTEQKMPGSAGLRPCRVDGVTGYFHRWIEKERGIYTIPASISRECAKRFRKEIIQGNPIMTDLEFQKTGTDIYALFEACDGTIHEVPANKVVFLDHEKEEI